MFYYFNLDTLVSSFFFALLLHLTFSILSSTPALPFFYPGTLLPLGSCRWTEEVLHEQSKDPHGEQRSVTALTTVWPTDQRGLSSGTQFLPDTPSLVPTNHFESSSSTQVSRITWVACCVFHHFFTLSCTKHGAMKREEKASV